MGLYRITEQGRAFAQGETRVPKFIIMYDEELLGFSDGDNTTIQEALGDDFNYRELMELPL